MFNQEFTTTVRDGRESITVYFRTMFADFIVLDRNGENPEQMLRAFPDITGVRAYLDRADATHNIRYNAQDQLELVYQPE